jgi:hypothetical protein
MIYKLLIITAWNEVAVTQFEALSLYFTCWSTVGDSHRWRMPYPEMWHPEDWQKCIDLLEESAAFIMVMESHKVAVICHRRKHLNCHKYYLSLRSVKFSELLIFNVNTYG